jgi:hypothetical protein
METPDILKDIEEASSAPEINKPRLFILHSIAALCLAFSGTVVSSAFFLPKRALDISNLSVTQQSEAIHSFEKEFNFFLLTNTILVGTGILIALIISFIICRRYKIHFVFALGVLAFSLLEYVFITKFLSRYVGFLMPGGYIVKQTGNNSISGIVNLIYLFLISGFLFFSKHSKTWWLK